MPIDFYSRLNIRRNFIVLVEKLIKRRNTNANSFTFRNMEAAEWLKDYADKKLSKIERYMDKPVSATVTLSIEKFRNVAELKLSAKGINLQGREEAKEMTLAIDNVMDKVERQIKKSKQKMRNHKDVTSRSEGIDTGVEEYDEYDENSKVVETKKVRT